MWVAGEFEKAGGYYSGQQTIGGIPAIPPPGSGNK